VRRNGSEASSNGRTADFGSAHEGSNPSASALSQKAANQRAEVKPLPRPPRVVVVALGGIPARLVADVGAAVQGVLGIEAKAGPALERPKYAFNEARSQYHTAAILRRLAGFRTAGAPALGIADFDLFVPDAPFVFGDADRDAGTALFSVARLSHADADKVRRRAQGEAIHEMGHLLGLSHCADYRCAMFLTRDVPDADRKGPGLCATCRGALGLGP
jgi:archaemetzincin